MTKMPPRGEPTHRAPRIPSELDVSLSRRFGGVLPGTALARRVHDPARPLAHTLLGKGRRGTHQFGGLESTPEPGVIEIPPSSSERSPAPRFEPPLIGAPAGDLLFEATNTAPRPPASPSGNASGRPLGPPRARSDGAPSKEGGQHIAPTVEQTDKDATLTKEQAEAIWPEKARAAAEILDLPPDILIEAGPEAGPVIARVLVHRLLDNKQRDDLLRDIKAFGALDPAHRSLAAVLQGEIMLSKAVPDAASPAFRSDEQLQDDLARIEAALPWLKVGGGLSDFIPNRLARQLENFVSGGAAYSFERRRKRLLDEIQRRSE